MVKIKFPDRQTEAEALGFLAGRFPFKSFDDGIALVPETTVAILSEKGIRFSVEGKPVYAELVPTIRDSASTEVQ